MRYPLYGTRSCAAQGLLHRPWRQAVFTLFLFAAFFGLFLYATSAFANSSAPRMRHTRRILLLEKLEELLPFSSVSGADWVRQHFADLSAPTRTGELAGRQTVDRPTLVDNARVTGDKYGIDVLGTSFGVVDS